jgi:hypothetical protein
MPEKGICWIAGVGVLIYVHWDFIYTQSTRTTFPLPLFDSLAFCFLLSACLYVGLPSCLPSYLSIFRFIFRSDVFFSVCGLKPKNVNVLLRPPPPSGGPGIPADLLWYFIQASKSDSETS